MGQFTFPDTSWMTAREDKLSGNVVYTAKPGTSVETVWTSTRGNMETSAVSPRVTPSSPAQFSEDHISLRLPNDNNEPEVFVHMEETPAAETSVSEVGPHAHADAPFHRERVYSFPLERYANLSYSRLERILEALQKRSVYLASHRSLQYIAPFASPLEHYEGAYAPHTDLIASPFVPADIERALETARQYYTSHGVSIFEHIVTLERGEGLRILFENDEAVVFCPFVSEFPYEIMIMPKEPQPSFDRISKTQRERWAQALSKALRSVKRALGGVECALLWYNAPHNGEGHLYFRWYMRVIPDVRTPHLPYQETPFSICPVAPEDAAHWLREG